MTLYFITGNAKKLEEIRVMIPDIEQLDLDVPEIQSVDTHEVLREKLEAAAKLHDGDFIVEDTALHLDCIKGLPGPFIKWFLRTLRAAGIADLVHKHDEHGAEAKTTIGLWKDGEMHFFEGVTRGTIVSPTEGIQYGFDPIFVPDGADKTYALMTVEEKNTVSHRGKAVRKLVEHLRSNTL